MRPWKPTKSGSNDPDSTSSSASWKKGTTKAERVCVMGAMAKVDLDESSLDDKACKKLVEKCGRSQKKSKKAKKKRSH